MGEVNAEGCGVNFGIMIGRWRIFKTGIRLHSVEDVDSIWCI